MMGALNTTIGKENRKVYMGNYGLRERNERENRLTEFVEGNETAIQIHILSYQLVQI